MAYAGELTGAAAPGPFIYVWPSRDLISRSWSWPTSWHDAFQDAASRIGLAVALYALDGGRFTRRLVSLKLSIGALKFRVKRRGNGLYITVVAFTGPEHSPDPSDDARQPSAVEGLILGLHGSGENSYLVVFHGQMPFIPAGDYRKATTLARLDIKNSCLARSGPGGANPQPILIYFNPGRGKSVSLVCRPLEEEHLSGHVQSKRLH
jgi:hypothetical protein